MPWLMTAQMSHTTSVAFLRLPLVEQRVGRSPRQIYRMVARDEFPPSRRQSHKVAVWYSFEIDAWVAWRMALDAGKKIASWRDMLPQQSAA
jgi:predicted DNA-binding transcriptional regulator AlpA